MATVHFALTGKIGKLSELLNRVREHIEEIERLTGCEPADQIHSTFLGHIPREYDGEYPYVWIKPPWALVRVSRPQEPVMSVSHGIVGFTGPTEEWVHAADLRQFAECVERSITELENELEMEILVRSPTPPTLWERLLVAEE